MSGVREERNNGSNPLGRPNLAGRDHNAEVNEVVVDIAGTGLDDVDILASDGVLDLAAAFTAREFVQNPVTGRDTENAADSLGELRVGIASQNDNIADHGEYVVRIVIDLGKGRKVLRRKRVAACGAVRGAGDGERCWGRQGAVEKDAERRFG